MGFLWLNLLVSLENLTLALLILTIFFLTSKCSLFDSEIASNIQEVLHWIQFVSSELHYLASCVPALFALRTKDFIF